MRIKNIAVLSLMAFSSALLTGCASNDAPPQPQVLSASVKTISKNSYIIEASSTNADTAKKRISDQSMDIKNKKECQSYNVISSDISVESKVLNPELAAALAEQAPKYGIGYLAVEERGLALEAAMPVTVYTCSSKVEFVNCKVK